MKLVHDSKNRTQKARINFQSKLKLQERFAWSSRIPSACEYERCKILVWSALEVDEDSSDTSVGSECSETILAWVPFNMVHSTPIEILAEQFGTLDEKLILSLISFSSLDQRRKQKIFHFISSLSLWSKRQVTVLRYVSKFMQLLSALPGEIKVPGLSG